MKLVLLCLADVMLILAGVVYGVKFLRQRNWLCGIEWLIMALSGTNFLLWAIYGWQACYDAAHFFDAFSRSFGFPVVAVAGLMAVTHGYVASRRADILYFLLGFAAAAVLVAADHSPAHAAWKPPFYMVTSVVFLAYLAYFALRLARTGERLHAASVVLVAVSGFVIAVAYDYVPIPGDDADRTLFYTAALSTWAFMMFALYHAYRALERALQAPTHPSARAPLGEAAPRRYA